MKSVLALCLVLVGNTALAQSGRITLENPTTIVVDSKDNVFVGDGFMTYKITPTAKRPFFSMQKNPAFAIFARRILKWRSMHRTIFTALGITAT